MLEFMETWNLQEMSPNFLSYLEDCASLNIGVLLLFLPSIY